MAAVANIVPCVIGLLSEAMYAVDVDPNKLTDLTIFFLSESRIGQRAGLLAAVANTDRSVTVH
jgi:hypothetical protein